MSEEPDADPVVPWWVPLILPTTCIAGIIVVALIDSRSPVQHDAYWALAASGTGAGGTAAAIIRRKLK